MNTATTANIQNNNPTAFYHLPGLFEFYELYSIFLPLFRKHREYFYDWCEIGSIYGAPSDCIWGGGRTSFGYSDPEDVLDLVREYGGRVHLAHLVDGCSTTNLVRRMGAEKA